MRKTRTKREARLKRTSENQGCSGWARKQKAKRMAGRKKHKKFSYK